MWVHITAQRRPVFAKSHSQPESCSPPPALPSVSRHHAKFLGNKNKEIYVFMQIGKMFTPFQ